MPGERRPVAGHVRQHATGGRLLGSVAVQRHLRDLVLRQHRRRLPEDPGRRLRGAVLERQLHEGAAARRGAGACVIAFAVAQTDSEADPDSQADAVPVQPGVVARGRIHGRPRRGQRLQIAGPVAGSPGASDPIHGPAATRGTLAVVLRPSHGRRPGARSQDGARAERDAPPAPDGVGARDARTPSSSAPATGLAPAAAHPTDAGSEALPVWLAPAGIAALFVAAAGTALVRRRRGASAH